MEIEDEGHGGGDIRLLKDVFLEDATYDPLNRKAGGEVMTSVSRGPLKLILLKGAGK
ncbi:MAG: hypothetical protein ACOCQW_04410 [Halanaerobiaceae bacterium]